MLTTLEATACIGAFDPECRRPTEAYSVAGSLPSAKGQNLSNFLERFFQTYAPCGEPFAPTAGSLPAAATWARKLLALAKDEDTPLSDQDPF